MAGHATPCAAAAAALLLRPKAIARAVTNLLDNAVQYTPAGGEVTVLLQRRGKKVQLTVRDNGPGIPLAERERVFERFYRLDRTQRGTGLGLPIVQHAVHSLGGRGIAFSIVLPHHTPAAGA